MKNRHALKPSDLRMGKERLYQVLVTPLITEKSTAMSEHNRVSFTVALDATKHEIKRAVEEIFKVKVVGVNTVVAKGKEKRFRGRVGMRQDRKKAYVKLAEGSTIDLSAGLSL